MNGARTELGNDIIILKLVVEVDRAKLQVRDVSETSTRREVEARKTLVNAMANQAQQRTTQSSITDRGS